MQQRDGWPGEAVQLTAHNVIDDKVPVQFSYRIDLPQDQYAAVLCAAEQNVSFRFFLNHMLSCQTSVGELCAAPTSCPMQACFNLLLMTAQGTGYSRSRS